ncbi:uncharacterized protein [Haliotis cracherodii]|uniref:uncharacterized protein n=1 Tax=Haliotis cracherodii TaxID=6455 RepID=UPI0039E82F05
MMSTGLSGEEHFDFCTRPKRQRLDGSKHYDVNGSGPKCLELEGVISVLKEYDDYDGGINCSMCGKLYKSKVCFIKHIWEHSIYWDVFADRKNHERVLSIQAALILYSGYHGVAMDDDNMLTHLLVTSPGNHGNHGTGEKKSTPESQILENGITAERKILAQHRNKVKASRFSESSPLKRKRED